MVNYRGIFIRFGRCGAHKTSYDNVMNNLNLERIDRGVR
jgi:hypothetical protein